MSAAQATSPAQLVTPPSGGAPLVNQRWGIQAYQTWQPGQMDSRMLCDVEPYAQAGAWRVTVVGDVELQLTWGTSATRDALRVDAPCVVTLPGSATVMARPRTSGGAWAKLTLSPSYSDMLLGIRRLVAGAQALGPEWLSYYALTASVVDVRGVAVTVPALSRVPLVSGSALVSGDGYLEMTP